MGTFIILLIAAIIYFLPSLIARDRKHNNLNSIVVLNIFLGWTILGWIGSLVWAFTNNIED